jgi:hypothetical protein
LIGFSAVLITYSSVVFASGHKKASGPSAKITGKFQYPIDNINVSLGSDEETVKQLFPELQQDNATTIYGNENYIVLRDNMYKKFYFKDNKLCIIEIRYDTERILNIPKDSLDKHFGKGKVIQKEPTWITRWKANNIIITRTDLPVSETGDSESNVVIKYAK